MNIVELNLNNLDELEELYKEQFKEEAWTKQQIRSAFNNKAVKYYGIFDGKKLVCFAGVLFSPDDINLLDIATKNEYKNQGFAKQMINFLIMQKSGNKSFSLEVKSKNTPAINLYNSFGFKTLHIRKKYYKDGDDALCMFLR